MSVNTENQTKSSGFIQSEALPCKQRTCLPLIHPL